MITTCWEVKEAYVIEAGNKKDEIIRDHALFDDFFKYDEKILKMPR